MALPRGLADQFADNEVAWLTALRRALHGHPELSWQEEKTAARLERALGMAGATDVRRVAGTGVVGRVPGHRSGAPAVAIRGDTDALPIQETTGLPYASKLPGVMHACGHDVHAAWAVGAALLLRKSPAQGDVLILLQPAEETADGAVAVLESGVLEGVGAIFGGHVDRRYEVGQVVAQAGPVAASADFFRVELIGTGAHGARPHESADPIVGAGALIGALQTLVSRRLDPATPGVVTVGTVHGGTAENIIPDRVLLTGTIRAVDPPSRRLLVEGLRQLADGIATAHGLTSRVTLGQGTPPVVNPPGAVTWAREAVGAVLGAEAEVPMQSSNMGGEDFAFYLERLTGCFLRIGAREPDGPWLPAHSPAFYPAEESLFVGAAVLAETARRASSALLLSSGPQ